MESITEKKCSKCNNILPISEFWKNKNLSDGYRYECKKCTKGINKEWRKENNDKRNESERKRYSNKIGEIRAYMRDWYSKNIEAQRERSKRKYENNKEKELSRISEWKSRNKDKVNSYSENRRARIAGNGGTYSAREWNDLCSKYGNKCLSCEADNVILTVDHVIPIAKGGSNTIDNIQPLCKSCNSKKHTKIIDYRK